MDAISIEKELTHKQKVFINSSVLIALPIISVTKIPYDNK